MSIEYTFIGWCRDEEANADKVWGAIKLKDGSNMWADHSYVTFWGRRGKKLQTKIVTGSGWDMDRMVDKKKDKGYVSIEIEKLNDVYPEFQADLEKTAFWNMFKV